ncbi:CsbD family protein [Senegalia massiliensis]|uniref:CsbD family protein n=1 Tax=Senegalia massiliensis TaxID=1720316 RepID=UPI00102F749E|nr:CsbD family protein [Senegalia massiliensis]
MDKSDLKAKWTQAKGEALRKWGKLTNDDLDVIEGDREKLVGKLQEKYDMSREEAEREVDSFRF